MSIPRDELIAAGQWLHEYYKSDDGLQRPEGLWIDGHPDWEGVGAWLLDVYVTLRERGQSDAQAKNAIVAEIRKSDEWRAKHPGPRPAPSPRGPLPPFPAGQYDRKLPWTPPQSRDFLRADAWGVTLPGLPFVPGGSSRHPERFLSWFFDRFPLAWQDRWLDQNAANGYTHAIQSAADSMGPTDNGPNRPPGNAQSLDQFVATCARIKSVLPYVTVFLGSKAFQPRDQSVAQWITYVDPIMDALIAANAVDEFVPAWEWDLFNVPGAVTIQVFKHIGQKAHAAGKSCWLHFSAEKTSWFADRDPRGRYGFYDDLGGDVDGLMYQTVPTWSIGETQARIVDTLIQFARQGNRHKFRFYEDQGALMFDNDRPNEDDANLRGYLACCTVDHVTGGNAKVWGYGGGCRGPQGEVI